MNEVIFFLKLHIPQVVVLSLCIAGGVAIALTLKYKPASFGFEGPKSVTPKSYAMCLFPVVIGAVVVFIMTGISGFSYATGIAVHENIVLVSGVQKNRFKNDDDGSITTTYTSESILFDKTTGKQITFLNGFYPLYFRGNKMLGDGGSYYQIIDLTTGKAEQLLSEDEIKDMAAELTHEKVYEMKFEEGDVAFNVRTVRDRNFYYDPIKNDTNNTESRYPFVTTKRRSFNSTDHKLFQPEVIGQTGNGVTVVLSYEDLEKKNYYIHAIAPEGNILWSKRNTEISAELDNEAFYTGKVINNTIIDDQHLYFVNQDHAVCMLLQSGELKWIASFR